MNNKGIVYISAPYSKGDIGRNILRVIQIADELIEMGYTPFIPHLNHLWHLISPKSWEFWMEYDLELLPRCDIVLRLDGDSDGGDREVRKAESLGLPVYYSLEEL